MSTADPSELPPGIRIRPDALRLQYTRSSGPGGQNVNKLNTKAELWVQVDDLIGLDDPAAARLRRLAGSRLTSLDEIHLSSDRTRSQERNRRDVLGALRELILQARTRPKTRRKTRPSRAARQRRLDEKRRRSQIKQERRTP